MTKAYQRLAGLAAGLLLMSVAFTGCGSDDGESDGSITKSSSTSTSRTTTSTTATSTTASTSSTGMMEEMGTGISDAIGGIESGVSDAIDGIESGISDMMGDTTR